MSTQLATQRALPMYYEVIVRPNASDYAKDYFNGCDKHYLTKAEAQEYLASFEPWEQGLLLINAYPF